jgi:hypothetical protein
VNILQIVKSSGCILIILISISAMAKKMPTWGASKPLPLETPKDSLKPGEFTWEERVATEGPILVVVSLEEQIAYAYRNGLLIGMSTISAGKKGHRTPTGVFTTSFKKVEHHSSKYNNAAMPYTQRITNDGVALHAGVVPGYETSHGCVHLPSEFARLLYNSSPMGMTVVVTDGKGKLQDAEDPSFLSPVTEKGAIDTISTQRLGHNEEYRWQPELSPRGPVSIIISGADRRMIVMRDGKEIGRCKITLNVPVDSIGTHLFVAQLSDPFQSHMPIDTKAESRKWISVNIQQLEYQNDEKLDLLNGRRISVPLEFSKKVIPIVTTGTTVLVTYAPILKKDQNVPLDLMPSEAEEGKKDTRK